MLNLPIATDVVKKLTYSAHAVANVLKLLYEENCTVPFIARYRKEATQNLDEVAIREIQNTYVELEELEKRKTFIIDAIKKQEKLTPALEAQILKTTELQVLEDLYAPFKATRKTKAAIAKEFGLEPLANLLLTSNQSLAEIEKNTPADYIQKSEGKITTFEQALNAAVDILIEHFAHHVEAKKKLRDLYWKEGVLISEMKKEAKEVEDYLKFKDFFDFKEPLLSLKEKKAAHRYLAMRRGAAQKVLKVEVSVEEASCLSLLQAELLPGLVKLSQKELLLKALKKSYELHLHPSLDLEIKMELKNLADEASIDVFGVNLKNLLLQPYLGSKAVLGIDPGQRTGCKIVVIDEKGKFIGDHVIYPHPPQEKVMESATILQKIIEQFDIKHLAIGNGTAGLDTLHFVQEHVKAVKEGLCHATMINEAGASIYSASDVAREEYPDKDVTVRGAISIAKRFQDPLAELVKIDAKSLGIGQYQHDVNQSKLQKSLDAVVESCVNFVGVDLNTASAQLLTYVSGIGPTVAKGIVNFRNKQGRFKQRAQLLEVSRFTDKTFQQAAGFLRIYDGTHPLDATFIHPEQYSVLENWCKEHKLPLTELPKSAELIQKLSLDLSLKNKIGEHTFNDIVKALKAPRQDPREEFKNIEFNKNVKSIKDLKIGEWYTGVIQNITNFGAFVDIGIKESGLLHISEMSNTFVQNALDHVQVGQEIKVRVTSLDLDRKRISLSAKTQGQSNVISTTTSASTPLPKNMNHHKGQGNFSNNPFANLKMKS